MPILDLKCEKCNASYPNTVLRAGEKKYCCFTECVTVWCSAPAVHLFKPQWVDHITDKPLHFDSKKKLKNELDRRGMRMPLTHG